jgi:hypothetical protein
MQPSPRPTLEHENFPRFPATSSIHVANGEHPGEAQSTVTASHGNDTDMNTSRAHANLTGRPVTSDSSVAMAQMEAAQRSQIAVHDSHGNYGYTIASQAHANLTGRPLAVTVTSDSSVAMAQMEAAQRYEVLGQLEENGPPVYRELLLPLSSGSCLMDRDELLLSRLLRDGSVGSAGHRPEYVVAPPMNANDVPCAMMSPAEDYAHGELKAGRIKAFGVVPSQLEPATVTPLAAGKPLESQSFQRMIGDNLDKLVPLAPMKSQASRAPLLLGVMMRSSCGPCTAPQFRRADLLAT